MKPLSIPLAIALLALSGCADPLEQHDLRTVMPEVVSQLRKYTQQFVDAKGELPAGGIDIEDPLIRQRLIDLGYLE